MDTKTTTKNTTEDSMSRINKLSQAIKEAQARMTTTDATTCRRICAEVEELTETLISACMDRAGVLGDYKMWEAIYNESI